MDRRQVLSDLAARPRRCHCGHLHREHEASRAGDGRRRLHRVARGPVRCRADEVPRRRRRRPLGRLHAERAPDLQARRRLRQGRRWERHVRARAVRAARAVRLRLPPRRLRRRGPLALHPPVQLQQQPGGVDHADQRRRAPAVAQGAAVRFHVVDRGVRRGGGPERAAHDRGDAAASRGPIRRREALCGARPQGRHAHVRPAVHNLQAAQRVRAAPEHRGQVPERGGHIHEPDPHGAGHHHLRLGGAAASLLVH
mmetsp:Transcript_38305/g.65718  ORF Transcript_38305/g.65718 Transcript_38305/m.65718 type:complete len:254 (-) Transcript_38305:495-1256(-)